MASSAPVWPDLEPEHPLRQLHARLPDILTETAGYASIWGITLVGPPADAEAQPDFHTLLILQKFLRANSNNVDAAFDQLKDTMVWRKSFFEEGGEAGKGWDDNKYQGLGYVTVVEEEEKKKVITWNTYRGATDLKKTFGDLDQFIRWRVALMEYSLARLDLASATAPIPDYDSNPPTVDPYLTIQIHDYKGVSLLRLPSEVKSASKKMVGMFARYYPETLERTYTVVPSVMSWVFAVMKKSVARATMKKLKMLSSSKQVASYLGEGVPEAYGGKGAALVDAGESVTSPVKITSDTPPATAGEGAADETKEGEEAAEEKSDDQGSDDTDTREYKAAAKRFEEKKQGESTPIDTPADAPKAPEAEASAAESSTSSEASSSAEPTTAATSTSELPASEEFPAPPTDAKKDSNHARKPTADALNEIEEKGKAPEA